MSEVSTIPLLLPPSSIPIHHPTSWRATKHLQLPEPQIQDDSKAIEMEAAAIKQGIDARPFKKVRPRRTVDYMGSVGRWNIIRKFNPDVRYTPQMRPAPPYIIDLLPPKAYSNFSTSLCTRFIHTSTNKIRCPVNVVTWTPEGRRVLTGSTSGEFTLWNGLTFNFETILQAHDSAIRSIQFSHSGSYIISADQSGIIKYFQPNMNNLKAWNAHREAIRGLSFSPDDERFVSGSDDSTVRMWNFEESREERVFTGHNWDVKCVEWHPTKGLLVSGSKDNLIKFWDPRTGTCLSTLYYHKNTIQALAWSPGGEYVASASRDQTVRLFDIRAMKEFKILKGHKKEVNSLTWHPVHPILVTGGSEGSILHWDITSSPMPLATSSFPSPTNEPLDLSTPTITPLARLDTAHDSNVWSLAFHPLGHLLVSASNDHTARFWSRGRPGEELGSGSGASGVRGGDGEGDDEGEQGDDGGLEDQFVPGLGAGGSGVFGAGVGAMGQDPTLPPGFVPLTNGVPSGPAAIPAAIPTSLGGGYGLGHNYGGQGQSQNQEHAQRHNQGQGHGRHQHQHQHHRQSSGYQAQVQTQSVPAYNNASYEPGGGMDMDDGIPGFGGGVPTSSIPSFGGGGGGTAGFGGAGSGIPGFGGNGGIPGFGGDDYGFGDSMGGGGYDIAGGNGGAYDAGGAYGGDSGNGGWGSRGQGQGRRF